MLARPVKSNSASVAVAPTPGVCEGAEIVSIGSATGVAGVACASGDGLGGLSAAGATLGEALHAPAKITRRQIETAGVDIFIGVTQSMPMEVGPVDPSNENYQDQLP